MLFDQNRVDAIIHNWKNQVFSNETIPGVPQRHSTCLKPPNGGFRNLASRSNIVWSSWKILNSQKISPRTRSEQGLSRSEHKGLGSVPVLSRSLHKPSRSLHVVKNPNFVYSRVDFMVLCERGFTLYTPLPLTLMLVVANFGQYNMMQKSLVGNVCATGCTRVNTI